MARGSRKHVLDWTSVPEFCVEFLRLLEPLEARISSRSIWMPGGHRMPAEARLETFGPRAVPHEKAWPELRAWWLAHEAGANTPNWDLAMAVEIEGSPGFILVEAKANVPELSVAGKPRPPAASVAGAANHERIGKAIGQASVALQLHDSGVRLSLESHYQLSNRLAFMWKLATLGIPTVVVYLGFTGDNGIKDAGEPFVDDGHWRSVFMSHAASVVPSGMFERRLDCGLAPAWLLIRSRPVLEDSQPRSRTAAVGPVNIEPGHSRTST